MKYVVRETTPFNQTRVFVVTPAGDPLDLVNVWLSHGKCRCTGCSTPLRGMSASCAHAAAVKRHLARVGVA